MVEWWQGLSTAEQVFAGMGGGFGALLFGLLTLSIAGADFDSDIELDTDLDAPGLFSIKGILSFLAFFGAGGYVALQYQSPLWLACIVALLTGYAVMSSVVYLLGRLKGLDADHNRRATQLLGQAGRVYLQIPGEGVGVGRIEVRQGGRIVEIEAETSGATIESGADVEVLDVLDEGRVLVRRR